MAPRGHQVRCDPPGETTPSRRAGGSTKGIFRWGEGHGVRGVISVFSFFNTPLRILTRDQR